MDEDTTQVIEVEEIRQDVEKVMSAHKRLDEHEEVLDEHTEVHQNFDRRISRNEDYRLQAMGALKILAFMLGSGGVLTLMLLALNIL